MIYLMPVEVLMLNYAYSFVDGDNQFQNFWNFRYNVSDPQVLLDNLLQEGYIAVGDISYQLQRLSTSEIKKYLSENQLKTSGKKADLIDRLVNSVDTTAIYNSLPHYYCLTDKGIAATQDPDYEYILYAHRNFEMNGLNINNVRDLMKNREPQYIKRAVLDDLLSKPKPSHFKIANLYAEMGEYESAFYYFVTDLRLFLDGQLLQFHDPMTTPIIAPFQAKHIFPYESSLLRIPYGRLRPLHDVIDKLRYSNDQLKQNIQRIVEQLAASQFFFTDNECTQIIYSELCEDTDTLTAIYKNAEQRFKAKYGIK